MLGAFGFSGYAEGENARDCGDGEFHVCSFNRVSNVIKSGMFAYRITRGVVVDFPCCCAWRGVGVVEGAR
jgi:hypothetical protein